MRIIKKVNAIFGICALTQWHDIKPQLFLGKTALIFLWCYSAENMRINALGFQRCCQSTAAGRMASPKAAFASSPDSMDERFARDHEAWLISEQIRLAAESLAKSQGGGG